MIAEDQAAVAEKAHLVPLGEGQAVDVGHNQLVWKLQRDPRGISMEGINARGFDVASLPFGPEIGVCIVSFISLTMVLPSLVAAVGPGGKPIVALVKRQFEVGKGEIGKGGVLREPEKRLASVVKCKDPARALGCEIVGGVESPISGPAGNVEYLLFVRTAVLSE